MNYMSVSFIQKTKNKAFYQKHSWGLSGEIRQSHGSEGLNPVFIKNYDILFIHIVGRHLKQLPKDILPQSPEPIIMMNYDGYDYVKAYVILWSEYTMVYVM